MNKNPQTTQDNSDKSFLSIIKDKSGKLGWIFLWLIGIPIPVLLVLYLIRGCT